MTNFEEQKDITSLDLFETIVVTRSFQKRTEYLSVFSSKMVEYMVEFPSDTDEFTRMLSQNMSIILDSLEPYHNMKDNVIIDYIIELSNYAMIFVHNEKYTHNYNRICKILTDIRRMNPCPLMDWEAIPLMTPIECDF